MPSSWSVPQTIVAEGSLQGRVRVLRRWPFGLTRGIVPSITSRSVNGMPLTLTLVAGGFADQDRVWVGVEVRAQATPQGFRNRQLFRETTLKLLPSPRNKAVVVKHRFIIGDGTVNEQNIEQEHKVTGDLLIVNTPDTADAKSAKLYDAIKWLDQLDFDYLVKTEDDVLVRMDTLSGELYKQGKKEFFWKGLVFKYVTATLSLALHSNFSHFKLIYLHCL